MQLPPSPDLSGLVKHYLIIENQAEGGLLHRFFADGHPGFVFSYADPFREYDNRMQSSSLPSSFVYGQVNRYHTLISGQRIGLLIVVMQPWSIYTISGIPGNELTNLQINCVDVFGSDGNQLQEQVLTSTNHISRISHIEAFLRKRRTNLSPELTSVEVAVQLIEQTNGNATIQTLTNTLNLTERSLERRFDKVVGIAPKQFSRIIRLQSCLKTHRQQPNLSLTELAYAAGYYDQAHFIHEFTRLVGLTPSQYEINNRRLAVNLMPLTA
ncbi:helix-turn-helix domain-containing protein [Spirosoma sp. SC4-14]|uniref:helix-turn-helix domain-containing protein n=1 Tax=Spirosoma sp. SC4-14 TaxID=3128900 RepID=UPI0030CAF7C1